MQYLQTSSKYQPVCMFNAHSPKRKRKRKKVEIKLAVKLFRFTLYPVNSDYFCCSCSCSCCYTCSIWQVRYNNTPYGQVNRSDTGSILTIQAALAHVLCEPAFFENGSNEEKEMSSDTFGTTTGKALRYNATCSFI